MNVFVFDIETVPDIEAGRKIHGLTDLSDAEVAEAMFHHARQNKGRDFLSLHLHQIVAISVVFRHRDQLKVWSLGDEAASEAELVKRFFDGIERYGPTIVSWNGGGFDLPVLHYRALLHGIQAPKYWDVGETDNTHKWNNYINRFHYRHTDLMDVLAGFQARAVAPLDEVATMLGFPGKMGMSGGKVWEAFYAGNLKAIRDYCETDVLNTYLVYLRLQLIRGFLLPHQYEEECARLVGFLEEQSDAQHFNEFLTHWQTKPANTSPEDVKA